MREETNYEIFFRGALRGELIKRGYDDHLHLDEVVKETPTKEVALKLGVDFKDLWEAYLGAERSWMRAQRRRLG